MAGLEQDQPIRKVGVLSVHLIFNSLVHSVRFIRCELFMQSIRFYIENNCLYIIIKCSVFVPICFVYIYLLRVLFVPLHTAGNRSSCC